MLREVMKRVDVGHIVVHPGDIVDVSGWKNAAALERHGYITSTNATKATVDQNPTKGEPRSEASEAPSATKQPVRLRRSVLASRPRVFSRPT